MYILDSAILSILQDRRGVESERIRARMQSLDAATVFVSVVTFQEQANGWSKYIHRARKSVAVVHGYLMFERLLTEFLRLNVLSFDDAAAKVFDDLKTQKVKVGTMDLRIASVALSRGFCLVTRNTVDFERVHALRIEDWTRG